jgi:hypothetical protein
MKSTCIQRLAIAAQSFDDSALDALAAALAPRILRLIRAELSNTPVAQSGEGMRVLAELGFDMLRLDSSSSVNQPACHGILCGLALLSPGQVHRRSVVHQSSVPIASAAFVPQLQRPQP